MIRLVTLQDVRLLDWAADKLNTEWDADKVRWIAGLDDDRRCVVFVLVYSRITKRNCELTIATDRSRRWATRRTLRAIFSTPFDQWGLRRLTFVVQASNTASMDLVERLGATYEGTIRKAFAGDVDGIVYGMLKEECKWN